MSDLDAGEQSIPYQPREMYNLLSKTAKAVLAITALYGRTGRLPSLRRAIQEANKIEATVRGCTPDQLEKAWRIPRSNVQRARQWVEEHFNSGPAQKRGPDVGPFLH